MTWGPERGGNSGESMEDGGSSDGDNDCKLDVTKAVVAAAAVALAVAVSPAGTFLLLVKITFL